MAHSPLFVEDADCLRRLKAGEQAAFEQLYERYFSRLYNYAYQKTGDTFLAQEVVQELFVRLWQQRGRLVITGVVSAYLFAAIRHLIIDQLRKEAIRQRHTEQFARDYQPLATNQTEEQVRLDELRQAYEQLLQQLPPKCRDVFRLSRQGVSHREIAAQLAISEKTVEQHITKALTTRSTTFGVGATSSATSRSWRSSPSRWSK